MSSQSPKVPNRVDCNVDGAENLGRGIGLQVIVAIQVVAAIGLLVAIGRLWNSRDPLGSLLEALVWVFLATLLLMIGWGLWTRRAWARLLALVVYWPTFVATIILLPLCLGVLILVPAGGIAVAHFFAWSGLILLPP